MNLKLRCYPGGNYNEESFRIFHLATTGHEMINQPGPMTIARGSDGWTIKYRPDFFCPHCPAFYEVIASKGIGSWVKHKLEAFRVMYPDLPIHPVRPDGSSYHFSEQLTVRIPFAFSIRFGSLRAGRNWTLRRMAEETGLSHETIRNLELCTEDEFVTLDSLETVRKVIPEIFPLDMYGPCRMFQRCSREIEWEE